MNNLSFEGHHEISYGVDNLSVVGVATDKPYFFFSDFVQCVYFFVKFHYFLFFALSNF